MTRSTRYAPYHEKELAGVDAWTREDKIAKFAEAFMNLKPQECIVKLPDKVYPWRVPYVGPRLLSPAHFLELSQTLQTNTISHRAADRILTTEETVFLERAREYEQSRPKRASKQTRALHPQR